MKSERGENWWCAFEWCILNTEKLWSSNKFKKMKSLCNTRVSSLFSCTFYVGEMMTPCQLSTFSEFICSAFPFQGLIAQKISKCMKNNKWSQKLLKIDDVALNGAFWTHKNYGVQISSKKWNPFVTDKFPYETLILRKRLSVCTLSASSFCLNPLYFIAHAMWVKWWYHANFQPFQSSFEMLSNFRVL